MDEEEREEGIAAGGGALVGRHVSKRSRKNKGLVIVFDANARKEFVTGFHKRKKKRRKIAEQQKQVKERQKRLQERKERRLALQEAATQSEPHNVGEGDDGESESEQDVCKAGIENGTVMYEDDDMTTVVNTYSIDMNTDDMQARSYVNHGKAADSSQKPTMAATEPLRVKQKSLRKRVRHSSAAASKGKHGPKRKKGRP